LIIQPTPNLRGKLNVAQGPAEKPDLVIEAGPQLKALMSGELTPAQAIKTGAVRVHGNRRLLATFADIFRVGAKPVNA
jgi:putative sterol carrier protein